MRWGRGWTSPAFSFFQNSDFSIVVVAVVVIAVAAWGEGLKGQKMVRHYQFQQVTLYISRNVNHIISQDFWHKCLN